MKRALALGAIGIAEEFVKVCSGDAFVYCFLLATPSYGANFGNLAVSCRVYFNFFEGCYES
jgi:hypothetical protein